MTRRLMRLATFCGVALLLSGFAAQADAGLLDLFRGHDGCCAPKKVKKRRCCVPAPPACCRPAPPPVCVQPAPVCCRPAPVCATPPPACCAPAPGCYAPGPGGPPPAYDGDAAPAPPAEEAAPAPEA